LGESQKRYTKYVRRIKTPNEAEKCNHGREKARSSNDVIAGNNGGIKKLAMGGEDAIKIEKQALSPYYAIRVA